MPCTIHFCIIYLIWRMSIMFSLTSKTYVVIRSFIRYKDGAADMGRQFTHLTCEEIQEGDVMGNLLPAKRIFEKDRSQRLHWINHHIQELSSENIEVFSLTERDQKKRCDVTKTYIYDKKERYVIVLECQRKSSFAP